MGTLGAFFDIAFRIYVAVALVGVFVIGLALPVIGIVRVLSWLTPAIGHAVFLVANQ